MKGIGHKLFISSKQTVNQELYPTVYYVYDGEIFEKSQMFLLSNEFSE
jgi:hypothetical protein